VRQSKLKIEIKFVNHIKQIYLFTKPLCMD